MAEKISQKFTVGWTEDILRGAGEHQFGPVEFEGDLHVISM